MEKTYIELTAEGRAPIKAWVRGVPLDEGAQRQLENTARRTMRIVGRTGKKVERRLSFKIAGEIQSKRIFDLSGPESVASLATSLSAI